jgi:hypothetical protein
MLEFALLAGAEGSRVAPQQRSKQLLNLTNTTLLCLLPRFPTLLRFEYGTRGLNEKNASRLIGLEIYYGKANVSTIENEATSLARIP